MLANGLPHQNHGNRHSAQAPTHRLDRTRLDHASTAVDYSITDIGGRVGIGPQTPLMGQVQNHAFTSSLDCSPAATRRRRQEMKGRRRQLALGHASTSLMMVPISMN